MKLRVLGVSGSQRTNSWSSALLAAMKELASPDLDFQIFEAHKDFPLFNPDLEARMPASVVRLREALAEADAVVIVSPEYAHGVSGTIKNALDWLVSDPGFVNKPVAAVNPSYQSYHADDALKETLRIMSAELIPGACLRIPVIGSDVSQQAIASSPRFSAPVRGVLQAIAAHVQARRQACGTD